MVTEYTFSDELVSDLHKDAYGFRPNQQFFLNWESFTDAEKQAEWDHLIDAMERREAERRDEEQRALVKFNKLIAKTIAAGAGDRKTAIQWLMDADTSIGGDVGYFEWTHGIPYGTVNGRKW